MLPIRWSGSWGLAFVPVIGYQKDRVSYDVVVLQAAGLLFLVNLPFTYRRYNRYEERKYQASESKEIYTVFL